MLATRYSSNCITFVFYSGHSALVASSTKCVVLDIKRCQKKAVLLFRVENRGGRLVDARVLEQQLLDGLIRRDQVTVGREKKEKSQSRLVLDSHQTYW
jgi:hypothetical protein